MSRRHQRAILTLVQERGPARSICPSEAARKLNSDRWRDHMEPIRRAAETLADRGVIVVTRGGEMVDAVSGGGPIRLTLRDDSRPDGAPCLAIINIGPVVAADLNAVGILTLGDLRGVGATAAYESVMVDKLHRGQGSRPFNAMYLYALFGAVQDVNCMHLSGAVREALKRRSDELRRDLLGREMPRAEA